MTIADQIINFNKNLKYKGNLPKGFHVLNPYLDNPETIQVMEEFYHKYYNDTKPRKFLIGINPSRHGAGVTGVPFTDTKRLQSECHISMKSAHTHELSSVYIYDMINEYGGVKEFYNDVYINSPFPLAITKETKNGFINANYYDDKQLFENVKPFMIESLKQQINFNIDCSHVFVLGKKNAEFIKKINKETNFFDKITALEHPRYIQQYKSKEKDLFIDKYIVALKSDD